MRAEDRVSAAIRESGTDRAGAFITCKLSRKPNVKAARESVHAATSIQPHYFRNLILPPIYLRYNCIIGSTKINRELRLAQSHLLIASISAKYIFY